MRQSVETTQIGDESGADKNRRGQPLNYRMQTIAQLDEQKARCHYYTSTNTVSVDTGRLTSCQRVVLGDLGGVYSVTVSDNPINHAGGGGQLRITTINIDVLQVLWAGV